MYDESRELRFPLMAGSSLPVSWRRPPLELDMRSLRGARRHRVLRRQGGIRVPRPGSAPVHGGTAQRRRDRYRVGRVCRGPGGLALDGRQSLGRDACWTQRSRAARPGSRARRAKTSRTPILFRLEYRSGLPAAVYILNGHCEDCTFAAEIRAGRNPSLLGSGCNRRPYSHFSALVHYIEQMIVTGREPYPPERTLLTTGALAALMDAADGASRRRISP